jgi:hypothetical protein
MDEPRQCCGCHANGLRRYLTGVAIAVTTALLIQSGSLVWWAATLTTRVQYVEKAVDGLNGRVHTIETSRSLRP